MQETAQADQMRNEYWISSPAPGIGLPARNIPGYDGCRMRPATQIRFWQLGLVDKRKKNWNDGAAHIDGENGSGK